MRIYRGFVSAALMAMVIMAMGGCSGSSSGDKKDIGPVSFDVSGTVTRVGSPLSGVPCTLFGTGSKANMEPKTFVSNGNGTFNFTKVENGNYLIIPASSGSEFDPPNLAVTVNGANLTDKNFIATATTVSTATGLIQLPKTGQTTIKIAGDDATFQKGVAWPSIRFTDNSDGTVTDNLTGLVWLTNANCFNSLSWTTALTSVNNLKDGSCDLKDSSTSGQWRLPNINELESLVDISKFMPATTINPIPEFVVKTPFTSVKFDYYWSSSSYAGGPDSAWGIYMGYGSINIKTKVSSCYVWPVRSVH